MKTFIITVAALLAGGLCFTMCNHKNADAGHFSDSENFSVEYVKEDFGGKQFVVGVNLVDRTTRKSHSYKAPLDEGSGEMGNLYYEDAISPNGKWVILPHGRFSGFQLIEIDEIGNYLSGDYNPNHIFLKDRSDYVYGFVGWIDGDSFSFSVRKSEMGKIYRYSIKNSTFKEDSDMDSVSP